MTIADFNKEHGEHPCEPLIRSAKYLCTYGSIDPPGHLQIPPALSTLANYPVRQVLVHVEQERIVSVSFAVDAPVWTLLEDPLRQKFGPPTRSLKYVRQWQAKGFEVDLAFGPLPFVRLANSEFLRRQEREARDRAAKDL